MVFSESYAIPSNEGEAIAFANTLAGHFSVTADGNAATVMLDPTQLLTPRMTLSLSPAIRQGQAVVVTYTDPTAGDDAIAIEDATGNETATFTTGRDGVPVVTNDSTVAPVPTSAAVAADGNSITVTFDESVDQTNLPAAGAFSVAADGAPATVSGVSAGTAAQLVLALAVPGIAAGQVVTLGYTDPTTGDDTNAVQDTAGNDAALLLRLLRHQQLHRGPHAARADQRHGSRARQSHPAGLQRVVRNPLKRGSGHRVRQHPRRALLRDRGRQRRDGHAGSHPAAHPEDDSQPLPAIRQGQAVVVTYTDPTAGDDAGAIEDAAGNETRTFTTGRDGVPAVTNDSTVATEVPNNWSLKAPPA